MKRENAEKHGEDDEERDNDGGKIHRDRRADSLRMMMIFGKRIRIRIDDSSASRIQTDIPASCASLVSIVQLS